MGFRESVEQPDADSERQLLTSDRVDETLEQRRKSWRLEASKAIRERAEEGIVRCKPVKGGEVCFQAEQTMQRRLCSSLGLAIEFDTGELNRDLRKSTVSSNSA